MRGSSGVVRAVRASAARALVPLEPPAWVHRWLGTAPLRAVARPGLALEVRDGADFSFARASVAEARALSPRELRRAAEQAYGALESLLVERGLAPLRIWNYLPAMRAREAGGASRYEVFNQGRHRAVRDWAILPAASAIDPHGPELEVHLLAGPERGSPIENPRQVPAYRYSRRYGPRPPCFARALRVGASVLVSGTASIVGEDSRHEGDLDAQLAETFANLEALAAAAPIARYRELRAYVVHAEHGARVARAVHRALPGCDALELVHADLCRPELLVEIEALADAAP